MCAGSMSRHLSYDRPSRLRVAPTPPRVPARVHEASRRLRPTCPCPKEASRRLRASRIGQRRQADASAPRASAIGGEPTPLSQPRPTRGGVPTPLLLSVPAREASRRLRAISRQRPRRSDASPRSRTCPRGNATPRAHPARPVTARRCLHRSLVHRGRRPRATAPGAVREEIFRWLAAWTAARRAKVTARTFDAFLAVRHEEMVHTTEAFLADGAAAARVVSPATFVHRGRVAYASGEVVYRDAPAMVEHGDARRVRGPISRPTSSATSRHRHSAKWHCQP